MVIISKALLVLILLIASTHCLTERAPEQEHLTTEVAHEATAPGCYNGYCWDYCSSASRWCYTSERMDDLKKVACTQDRGCPAYRVSYEHTTCVGSCFWGS